MNHNELIVTGSADTNIKFWRLNTGEYLGKLRPASRQAESMSLTENGRDLVVASLRRLDVFDVTRPDHAKISEVCSDRTIGKVLYEPHGRWICAGDKYGTCKIWDVRNSYLEKNSEMNFGYQAINSMVLIPGTNKIIVALEYGKVYVWDVTSGKKQKLSLLGEVDCVEEFSISPSGKRLNAITRQNYLLYWDLTKRSKISTEYFADLEVISIMPFEYGLSCHLSWDGEMIGVSGMSCEIEIIDSITYDTVATLNGDPPSEVFHSKVYFAKNQKNFIAAGGDGCIRIWETDGFEQIRTIKAHDKQITAMCIK